MRFSDIIGQREIKEHLQKAISEDKFSHAYIISGERGMGKRTMAEASVQTLFCEKHGADACDECPTCSRIKRRNHPDVIYIEPEDGKKSVSIDDIREHLVSDVYIRPYSSPYKVYIIPDADTLSIPCQNAILKTIEEPPGYVRLLLLAENASRLLPTIRSRCVELSLKPVTGEDERIRKLLMSEYELPEYVISSILQFSLGNIGRALELASGDVFKGQLDMVFHLASHIGDMYSYEIAREAASLKKKSSEEGLDLMGYLDLLLLWYRDVLLYKSTEDPYRLYFTDHLREIMRQADLSSYAGLNDVINGIESTKQLLVANIAADTALSLLMHRIKTALTTAGRT